MFSSKPNNLLNTSKSSPSSVISSLAYQPISSKVYSIFGINFSNSSLTLDASDGFAITVILKMKAGVI